MSDAEPERPSFLPLSLSSLSSPSAADDAWLDDVALLIGNAEREAYLRLAGEAERQEFIRRFWEVRDPYPQTERNELQEGWTARLAEARQRWELGDDRSRALLLRGEPDTSFEASCPGAPVYEFWVYEPTFQVKHRSVLVFMLGERHAAKLWQPGPDAPKLHPPSIEGCSHGGAPAGIEVDLLPGRRAVPRAGRADPGPAASRAAGLVHPARRPLPVGGAARGGRPWPRTWRWSTRRASRTTASSAC